MKHTGRRLASLVSATVLVLAGCAGATATRVQSGSPGIRTIGIARVAAPSVTVEVGSEGRYAMSEARKSGLPARQGPTGTPAMDAMGGLAQAGSNNDVAAVVLVPVILLMAPMIFAEILGDLSGDGDAGPAPGEEMPSDMLDYYKAQLDGAVSDFQLPDTLQDSVFNEISGETGFGVQRLGEMAGKAAGPVDASEPVDTILQIDDAKVALVPKGRESTPRLMLYAKFHFSRADTGERLYSTEVATTSDSHRFRDWMVNDVALFRRALEGLIEPLARQAIRNALLDLPNPRAGNNPSSGRGFHPIKPVYPEIAESISLDFKQMSSNIDSLKPTLRWQKFPSKEDIAFDFTGQLERATNVTYDLKISSSQSVHDVEGLTHPSVTLSVPLESGTLYHWTVRARFEVDGYARSTKWMAVKNYSRIWAGECGQPYDSIAGEVDVESPPKWECYPGIQTPADPWRQAALIRPITPVNNEVPDDSLNAKLDPVVASLRPTLQWQVFPSIDDTADTPPGRLERATNVTYSLQLWRQGRPSWPKIFDDLRPGAQIYNLERLSENSLTLPEPLEPNTLYFWTVKAQFEVDGASEQGTWMVRRLCADKNTGMRPSTNCLARFRTPVEQSPNS